MRIRSPNIIVIVILWMMLSPAGSAVSLYGGSEVVNDNPEILSVDDYESNLTWTSRAEHTPQLVENYSVVAGDHVIINGSFSELLNVTECVLTIWNPETGINATVSNVGSSITFDTYYLDGTNQTYNIIVNGTTNTNDFVIILGENVTISNFFSPVVTVNAMVEIGDDTMIWNLTWSSTDTNANDTPYYSVWLSRDAGVTFVLLIKNISLTWYIWDSTDWLQADYIVRIRAFSVDVTSSECNFENPPESYWPGDYSDGISTYFEPTGGIGHGMPTYYSISTTLVTYEFGSIDNVIQVSYMISSYRPLPSSLEYSININSTQWRYGEYSPSFYHGSFPINIDGLPTGTHLLSIFIRYFSLGSERVTVDVTPSMSNTTSTDTSPVWTPVVQSLLLGVSIGSISVIVLVLILSLRLKRKRVIEYV